jgi:predicted histone-like DNA-binding protein
MQHESREKYFHDARATWYGAGLDNRLKRLYLAYPFLACGDVCQTMATGWSVFSPKLPEWGETAHIGFQEARKGAFFHFSTGEFSMSISLKKVSRANPQNRSEQKWYFTQNSKGYVDIDQICQDILELSSLTPGDVRSAVESLKLVIQKRLEAGYSVRLDGFGTFHATVASEGADTPEALTVRNVKQVRPIFTASTRWKNSLAKARFEIGA